MKEGDERRKRRERKRRKEDKGTGGKGGQQFTLLVWRVLPFSASRETDQTYALLASEWLLTF